VGDVPIPAVASTTGVDGDQNSDLLEFKNNDLGKETEVMAEPMAKAPPAIRIECKIQLQEVELAMEADEPPVTFEPDVAPHHEPAVAPIASAMGKLIDLHPRTTSLQ
jgi:hypothetical protein